MSVLFVLPDHVLAPLIGVSLLVASIALDDRRTEGLPPMTEPRPANVRCWCVPPGTIYFMDSNPCRWPDCPNAELPDPAEPVTPSG